MDNDKRWKRWITYTFHGIHHEYPKDKDRIVMPPAGAILISSIIFGGFWLILQKICFCFCTRVFSWLFSLCICSLCNSCLSGHLKTSLDGYGFITAFTTINIPINYFGVSTPLWDYIFQKQFQIRKINGIN